MGLLPGGCRIYGSDVNQRAATGDNVASGGPRLIVEIDRA
jgi:hypothetical protein